MKALKVIKPVVRVTVGIGAGIVTKSAISKIMSGTKTGPLKGIALGITGFMIASWFSDKLSDYAEEVCEKTFKEVMEMAARIVITKKVEG